MPVSTHICDSAAVPAEYAMFSIRPPFGSNSKWVVILFRQHPDTAFSITLKGENDTLQTACDCAMTKWPAALAAHYAKAMARPITVRRAALPTKDFNPDLDFLNDDF